MPPRRHVPEAVWDPWVQAFGARVAALRNELGISQLELSNRTGLAANSIKLIERGRSSKDGDRQRSANPRLDTVCLLADAFGLTPAELLAPLGAPMRSLSREQHAALRPRESAPLH